MTNHWNAEENAVCPFHTCPKPLQSLSAELKTSFISSCVQTWQGMNSVKVQVEAVGLHLHP